MSGFASIGFGRATTSSASGRPSAVDPACSEVDSMGFTSSLDSGDQCYLYQQITIEGRRLRVYYRTSWQSDTDRQSWISEAFDGLATSVVVYSDFDVTIGDINAVFSLAGSGAARAAQSYFGQNEACPITIYPAGTGRGDGRLQQTLAHETFHCIQDWTYTTSPYSTHKWLEGSATYFSNVVYPALNDEYQWTDPFDRDSRTWTRARCPTGTRCSSSTTPTSRASIRCSTCSTPCRPEEPRSRHCRRSTAWPRSGRTSWSSSSWTRSSTRAGARRRSGQTGQRLDLRRPCADDQLQRVPDAHQPVPGGVREGQALRTVHERSHDVRRRGEAPPRGHQRMDEDAPRRPAHL